MKELTSRARQLLINRFMLVLSLACSSILKMEANVPPKRRLISNEVSGVISQNIEIFITAAVRTSHLTYYYYLF
jgi:hypothetical protein